MARIDPLPEAEWSDDVRSILDATPPGLGARLGDNNIFTTFARHPDLFRAWLPFGGFLLQGATLSARDRELLILRTAVNCASSYEWGQHVRIAERIGMPREEIDRVAAGPDAPGWAQRDALLLRAADELHAASKISAPTWAGLAAAFGDDRRVLLEIPFLVGHYHLVAYALNSAEVELDDGLEPLP